MARWFRSERGWVSVYFMLVLSALILFQSVLLDFARLHVARLRTQQAADAALRSVYAGFDTKLQTYGLYGLDTTGEAEMVFEEVLKRNLASPGILSGRGSWVPVGLVDQDEKRLLHADSLGDAEVFRYQILEEMKVRAPIEFTLQVLDTWQRSPALESVQQTKQLSSKMKKIEGLLKQRNDKLEQVGVLVATIASPHGLLYGWHRTNEGVHAELAEQASSLSSQTIASLSLALQAAEEEVRLLQDEIDQASAEAKPELEEELSSREKAVKEMEITLVKLQKFVQLVAEHDVRLAVQEEELKLAAGQARRRLEEAQGLNRQAAEQLGTLDLKWRSVVRIHDDAQYDRWLTGVGEWTARYAAYSLHFDPGALLTGRDFTLRHQRLNHMNAAIGEAASWMFSDYQAWMGQLHNQVQGIDRARKEQTERAKSRISESMLMEASCSITSEPHYTKLEARQERYGEAEGMGKEKDAAEDPEAAMGAAFRLMEGLEAALLGVRDKAYVNEFALTKFNFRTLNGATVQEKSDPMLHALPQQEAEYILYGWNSCYLNHSSAFSEMFLMRLAIRTAEHLVSPEKSLMSLGSPWLVFLWAVAEGAGSALRDMQQLVSGASVRISDKLPMQMTMTYKDHLRLFMLLHGNETAMLRRMQALIDLNTGTDLRERAVLTEARVKAEFRPWVIPAAPGWLGFESFGDHWVIPSRAAHAY